MFYMRNRCGAWQSGGDATGGAIEFRVFFPAGFDPEISSIRVAGNFQNRLGGNDWDFPGGLPLAQRVTNDGTFWEVTTGVLSKGFYEYKYLVTFPDGQARIVTDPCTRYGGRDSQNSAIVIGGSQRQQNVPRRLANRKPLRDLIVYELMLDDFTDEYRGSRAPLDAVVDRLDYLAELGFNAILFMPWTAWKNLDFDWGYEPFQYFSVEYRYANDLFQPTEKLSFPAHLVDECHARGIHVIMDGVFNHVSFAFPYVDFYRNHQDCPFTGTFGGQFPGLQDLNFNNRCTQDFVRDVCLYFIDEFRIDGIRFDNTTNFNVPGKQQGLPTLLEEVADAAANDGPNFSLTLEHQAMDAAEVTRGTEATSYWDNELYGRTFEGLWNGGIDRRLLQALDHARFLNFPEEVPTQYLSNHDHSHVTWQAGARDNAGLERWYKTQPYAIRAIYRDIGAASAKRAGVRRGASATGRRPRHGPAGGAAATALEVRLRSRRCDAIQVVRRSSAGAPRSSRPALEQYLAEQLARLANALQPRRCGHRREQTGVDLPPLGNCSGRASRELRDRAEFFGSAAVSERTVPNRRHVDRSVERLQRQLAAGRDQPAPRLQRGRELGPRVLPLDVILAISGGIRASRSELVIETRPCPSLTSPSSASRP